jgi:hypothetical protein
MAVYVDSLKDWGWKLRGRTAPSCHMFTDEVDLTALHEMALRIGMQTRWFQNTKTAPHYDLVASRRAQAVACGAVEVDRREAVAIWRARRDAAARANDPANVA